MPSDTEQTEGDVTDNEVGALVRRLETNYISGSPTTISKYVQFDMAENINKIDAYLNSKHISGETDSLGREKPFFNIVTAAVNIWYRATDIDRKNIKIKATKEEDVFESFLATVHLQNWMRRENFGAFLNEWGRSLVRYGSSVVKFVEQGGRLIPQVIAWNRLIVDTVDFDNNVKIEVLELTEAQLRRRKGYDKEMVDKLCNARQARQTIEKTDVDTNNDFIKLYEVHGELPLSYLTGKGKDADTYVQQMHVISFVESKEEGKFDDYTLISGREKKDPYMITHLIKEDGRTQAIGAVEHLFDAQWMQNHTVKSIKDQLDLASKLIFQTADGNFVGQNALTAIETGDILIHSPNNPLTQLQNNAHDITSLQSFGQMWKALAQDITSTPDALMGNNAPSGTAWRQVEALQGEAHSLFELMTQNKGLHIEDMLREYVIPFIKTKMDTKEEAAATLEDYDISRIDARFVKNSALKVVNHKLVQMVLNDQKPTTQDQQNMIQAQQGHLRDELASLGNQRFFVPSDLDDTTWKEALQNLEWDVEVDVTGESNSDKDDLDTLTTVFQTIADPVKAQVLNTPQGKFIFNKILTLTGAVSPLELASQPTPSPLQPLPVPVAPAAAPMLLDQAPAPTP